MTEPPVSDEQLMLQVQRGRQDALAALYDRYSRAVYGMALQKLADPAEAQDVTHDVFVNLWLKSGTFRPERGRVQSWLLTTAHHRIVDRLRRRQRTAHAYEAAAKEVLIKNAGEDLNPAHTVQKDDDASQVRQALLGLPEEQREVLVLAYYQGLSQTQIAERLRTPLGTVKARTRLAMGKLRAALGE